MFSLFLVDPDPALVPMLSGRHGKKKKPVNNGYGITVTDASANKCNQPTIILFVNVKVHVIRNVKLCKEIKTLSTC